MNRKYISQTEFERIERYLLDQMDSEERAHFVMEMEHDEQLLNEVDLQRKLLAAVESGSVDVDELLKKEKKTSRTIHFWHYRWHAVAASVVLVVGVWYLGFRQSPEEKLFATYFVPPKGLITPMNATNDYVFYDAMVDYKQKNYRQALTKWSPLLEQQPTNDTLNFFIGIAHLSSGNVPKSIPYLEHTTTVTESVFTDEAWFYLGMAYLKQGDTAQAKASLGKSSLERSKTVLHHLNGE